MPQRLSLGRRPDAASPSREPGPPRVAVETRPELTHGDSSVPVAGVAIGSRAALRLQKGGCTGFRVAELILCNKFETFLLKHIDGVTGRRRLQETGEQCGR